MIKKKILKVSHIKKTHYILRNKDDSRILLETLQARDQCYDTLKMLKLKKNNFQTKAERLCHKQNCTMRNIIVSFSYKRNQVEYRPTQRDEE